ncbi:MAG: DUF2399 domain-containing protein [Acidimicrobiales bacterium]
MERPSLTGDGLDQVWTLVRARLESRGTDNRGRVRLPPLTPPARLTLKSLLGRPPSTALDLARLEAALVALHLGDDLVDALAALGHPVSGAAALKRAEQAAAKLARDAARAEAAGWPEPWAGTWIDEVVRAGVLRGLERDAAVRLVQEVRRVLDHLDAEVPTSRVDLAADRLGSSHALDPGTRLEAAATRALAHRLGPADTRDLWERAGAHLDLTSGPALVWRLPLRGSSGLFPLTEQATALGVPVHLTQLALRRHPAVVQPGTVILVAENPRVAEAAAQTASPTTVVAANGNPSGAVRLLVRQLLDSGAELRYHGDFDAAGLAMCARMAALGLTPWRMGEADYVAALEEADRTGIELPLDAAAPGPTPWNPPLQGAFEHHRRVVHEERLLAVLLVS